MNFTIKCIVLLASITFCTSARILTCKCIKAASRAKLSLIADVREYEPSPYCSKHEVIVTMKDESQQCLIPESNFTKALLKKWKTKKENADRMKNSQPNTTTAATKPI